MNIGKEIKSKINCIDMAHELNLDLTKNGDSYRCVSFIRSDSTNPSGCQISQDFWYSYSDGVGGDVIDMLAYARFNGDTSKAFRELANRFGLSNTDTDITQEYLKAMDDDARYIEACHRNLRPIDREYLHNRRITDATIDEFHIGYDERTDRLIIPIFKNNKPVYWCGRDRSGKPNVSKYTKADLQYHPNRENIMYGFDTLNNGSDTLIIAEGVFDYLSLHQEGYACLSNATAISNENIKNVTMLAHKFKRTILCFDNDVSGSAFTQRLYPALFRSNINFEVCFIPKTQDIKDISDWYSRGFSLETLFTGYVKNGTLEYLKLKYDDFDTLYEYVEENAPYIGKKTKEKILEYATECLKVDKNDYKMLEKTFSRGKTDLEMANELIRYYDGYIKNIPELGIYVYNNVYWEKMKPEKIKSQIVKLNNKLTSQRVTSVFNMVSTITVTDDMPDQKNCLNLKNGTLYIDDYASDISQSITFSTTRNPNDFCTYMIDYDYNPKKRFDKLDYFFDTITCYDEQAKQFLIECMGSTLYSDNKRLRKAYLFYGEGSNGKSLYENLVKEMLGGSKNVSEIQMHNFNDKFEIVRLQGKRANLCHEAKADVKGTEDKFKSIVAGESVGGRELFKMGIEIIPRCKIFIDCNELPRSSETAKGWYDRFLPYEFKARFVDNPEAYKKKQPVNTSDSLWVYENPDEEDNIYFKKDPNLERQLIAPENLPAVLNLAIEGFFELRRNGDKFTPFGLGDDISQEMLEQSNNVITFVNEEKWKEHLKENGGISTQTLYNVYYHWCMNNGLKDFPKPEFMKLFKKEVKAKGYKIKDPHSVWENGKSAKGILIENG